MKYIQLTQGKKAIVDDGDFEWLNQWKWAYKLSKILKKGNEYGIAVRGIYDPNRKQNKIIRMHRIILGINDPKIFIDHRNGNPLDNRRKNLRIANINQNNWHKQTKSASGFKNVYPVPNSLKWYTKIMINKKNIYLGSYISKEEAARVYNKAARKYHKEFASLNII